MIRYNLDDMARFVAWLGHEDRSEFSALNPNYRKGREHAVYNRENETYPKHAYPATDKAAIAFALRHHRDHLIAVGLNDRPEVYLNHHGYPRAAKGHEVLISRSLMLDIDTDTKPANETQIAGLESLLDSRAVEWFRDNQFLDPAIGLSGNGAHLLVGYEPILVRQTPDISRRLKLFAEWFQADIGDDLSSLDMKTDTSVHDIARKIKLYGTAKPGSDRVARWYGGDRVEDDAVRDYLLGLDLNEPETVHPILKPAYGPTLIRVDNHMPRMARSLLEQDPRLKDLWEGRGKTAGDTSRSGYDFSLVRRYLVLGYRDLDGLATVLATRPDGAVRQANRGEDYIRLTLANAIRK